MGLKMVYGRAGCGKSYTCYQQIKSKLSHNKDGRYILIVPEQYSLQAEKELLDTIGITGINNAEVLSFRRLAFRVFNEVGGVAEPHINNAGKSMLIYRTIKKLTENNQLNIFTKGFSKKGFINSIDKALTEFKHHDISCDDINNAAQTVSNTYLKSKLIDLYLIFNEYTDNLKGNYIDSNDDLSLLSTRISDSEFLKQSKIWIDEFKDFTRQQLGLISSLVQIAEEVTITFTTDYLKDLSAASLDDVFTPVKNSVRDIIDITNVNNTKDNVTKLTGDCRFKNKTLSIIEKYIFSSTDSSHKIDANDIELFYAKNNYTEIVQAAEKIIELTKEKGLRYREIAVTVTDFEEYEGFLRTVFDSYSIPYFIDSRRDITSNPVLVYIFSLFDIINTNFRYSEVFRFLKTGMTDIKREEIDLLENYVIACNIRGTKWKSDFEHIPHEFDQDDINNINKTRQDFVCIIEEFESIVGKCKKAVSISKSFYSFLVTQGIPEKIHCQVEKLKSSNQDNKALEYIKIWDTIVDVLDQVVQILDDTELDIGDYASLFKAGFEEYTIGVVPATNDCVQIGSTERSRTKNIKALLILGVIDGSFPRTVKQTSILNDSDRAELEKAGISLAGTSRDKIYDEQFLAYQLLTSPREYLYVSYPIADVEGKTKRPSYVVSRLKRIYANIKESSDILEKNCVDNRVSLPYPTFNRLINKLSYLDTGINNQWYDVLLWFDKDKYWHQRLQKILDSLNLNQNAEIDIQTAQKLFGEKSLETSVSRLEQYQRCPFSYYLQYGLKAQPRSEFKLQSLDIGLFIHHALEVFSTRIKDDHIPWNTVDEAICNKYIPKIVDNYLDQKSGYKFKNSKRYEYQAHRLKRVLTRAVLVNAEQIKRGEFRPYGFELAFGDKNMSPISIKLEDGRSVQLKGRVDRADLYEVGDIAYLRIIDYKSGNKAFSLSEIYNGLTLQLILYLDVLCKSIKGYESIIPAGLFYITIDNPLIRSITDMEDSKIDDEILKKLKMKGLVLSDTDIIKKMDRSISGSSTIIPARINKDGNLGKSSAATKRQFEILTEHVLSIIKTTCKDILTGKIDIEPYKLKDNKPCDYCDYLPVCGIDKVNDTCFRLIQDYKDDEVWSLVENGGEDDGC